MTTTTSTNGRLGNQIIRNLVISLIAEKNNLRVTYSSYELIQQLGINLFIGNNIYPNTILLTDDNFFNILHIDVLNFNLNPNNNYFQTKDITTFLYNYLQSDNIKSNIINKNQFKQKYNNNNDLFVHIRLGDVAHFNPGIDYYINTIANINFDKLYISTDEKNHCIITQLIKKYPNIILINYNEINTIQFGSTCKNIILSHGSFSAIIGYLSFYSNVYYPNYDETKKWYGDMFSINGWITPLQTHI
jgi:hypothetical protein